MSNYFIQDKPFVVPTTDNKIIKEHFGVASFNAGDFSLAHMVAPPQWSEPHQTPEFDEITLIVRGRKLFEIDGEEIVLEAGKSILIKKGSRVRYSNPFTEPCEYVSLCMPAFSIEKVHREQA